MAEAMTNLSELAARNYEAEARDLLQARLRDHADEGVRAIALVFDPPKEIVQRIAAALRAKEVSDHG